MNLNQNELNCLNDCIFALRNTVIDFVEKNSHNLDMETLNKITFEAPLLLFIFFCHLNDVSLEEARNEIFNVDNFAKIYKIVGESLIDKNSQP